MPFSWDTANFHLAIWTFLWLVHILQSSVFPIKYSLNSSTMERRLAAILAANVVGYSHLMSEDEEGTFTPLQKSRATADR